MLKCFEIYKHGAILGRRFATASMSATECFSALGIPIGSDEDKIKQAFRRLAKTHHPDLGGSTDRFVKIQQAYEQLMDPSFRRNPSSSSNPYSSSGSSSSSQYWRSWDTSSSWWGGGSNTYSTDHDFDAEFEEQWRRFTKHAKQSRGKKFRARTGSQQSMDDDDTNSGESREQQYKSESQENRDRRYRGGRKSKKTQAESPDLPDRLKLVCLEKSLNSICGDYTRTSNFNGRICFASGGTKARFVFWSNKNKDWKISEVLRDDGNCLAFNSKVHPSIDCPFILGDSSKWMVWSDRARRFLPCKIQADDIPEDFSKWSIERLRDSLISMGLEGKVERCVEKQELIDLMNQFSHLRKSLKKKMSANDPIPEGSFRLCSRQRHDGVVQAPPVLSDSCRTGNNRVDSFLGPLSEVEEWLVKFGDRRRYYGVFDSDRNYCFGLLWKNNKQWSRAGPHDW